MITIVSGGQTGVDRAALDAAISLNIPYGGWCPKGRLAEDGVIPEKYLLKETDTSDYSERTKLNIRDSDGTIVIFLETLDNITDGTILTVQELKEKNKPYMLISLSENFDITKIISWINENKISILNTAGPRESQTPGIYLKSLSFMEGLLSLVKKNQYTNHSHTYLSKTINSLLKDENALEKIESNKFFKNHNSDDRQPFFKNVQEKKSENTPKIESKKNLENHNISCMKCTIF